MTQKFEYAKKWLELGLDYLDKMLGDNIYDSKINPKIKELEEAIEILEKAGMGRG